MDSIAWVAAEFCHAHLGDPRRDQRLIEVMGSLASHRGSFSNAFPSSASLKGALRFMDNHYLTDQSILEPHRDSTVERAKVHPVLLAANDTTELNYSAHQNRTTGLGYLRKNSVGLLMHSTLLMTPDRLALGLLDLNLWTRPQKARGKSKIRRDLPIEQKESAKWLRSLHTVNQISPQCPDSKIVVVGDREADVFELFCEDREAGVELLVRATQNRRLFNDPATCLRDHIAAQPVRGVVEVDVARLSKINKSSDKTRKRASRKARVARMDVRFSQISLQPPQAKADTLPAVEMWVVDCLEATPPEGQKPLHWTLLTSCKVDTLEQAFEIISWYKSRWLIETFHLVLKSGFSVEKSQLETEQRLERSLTLYSILAWRVLYIMTISRTCPDLPCTKIMTEDEWKALWTYQGTTQIKMPTTPPTIAQATQRIVRLAGFQQSKDTDPGAKTFWSALQSLQLIADAYISFRASLFPQTSVPR